jgi:hypothetical protein
MNINNCIMVRNGVVRFIATGLIPEDHELAELIDAKKITDKEEKISSDARKWEMVEV